MASISPLVQSDDIVAARELLRDVISPTPVLYSRVLSEAVGGPVYLKCENLQRTGSFKVRGAYTRIARLSDDERSSGVVAASAGNHAQGVAFAAGLLGASATVVMPERAPIPKVEATRGYGASVVLARRLGGGRARDGARLRGAHRKRVHPPVRPSRHRGRAGHRRLRDHRAVPAGRDHPGPGRRRRPRRRDRGGGAGAGPVTCRSSACRPRRCAAYQASFAAGQPGRRSSGAPTMADGIAVQPAWRHRRSASCRNCATGSLRCQRRRWPAGCCSAWNGPSRWWSHRGRRRSRRCSRARRVRAADRRGAVRRQHRPAAAVQAAAARAVRRGTLPRLPVPRSPTTRERWPGCCVTWPTSAPTSSRSATSGWRPRLPVDEVEVVLQVETRGPEHCEDVKAKLRADGYTLSFS